MQRWLIAALIVLSGCNGGMVDRLLKRPSPYEEYLTSLESTALANYALVKDWKKVGQEVLFDSLLVDLPYHEIGYFDPKQPDATFIRYQVQEGQRINISLEAVSQTDARFFMDVFEWDPADFAMERMHFADSSGQISYPVKESGVHALRIQPELFRGGVFSLSIVSQGTLAFPIPGLSSRNIASFWGDPRDGDARKHEGVDIFAKRGTPVIAASPGRVRSVGNNRLGGKVVWLSNSGLGHSQYYAHLDSQLVQPGQRVEAGDTLGLVGNTGNAITTAPHLHFGIYRSGRGAVDPFPFLMELSLPEWTPVADSVYVGEPVLIRASLANIRRSPTTASAKVGAFDQNTLVQVKAKSGRWYRVSLPNNEKGYIYDNLVAEINGPIRELVLHPLDEVREFWEGADPISGDLIAGNAQVLGEFQDSYFVETASGIRGWWKSR